jgi:hypothetical protein
MPLLRSLVVDIATLTFLSTLLYRTCSAVHSFASHSIENISSCKTCLTLLCCELIANRPSGVVNVKHTMQLLAAQGR